jgi:hypothetical protein
MTLFLFVCVIAITNLCVIIFSTNYFGWKSFTRDPNNHKTFSSAAFYVSLCAFTINIVLYNVFTKPLHAVAISRS